MTRINEDDSPNAQGIVIIVAVGAIVIISGILLLWDFIGTFLK